MTTSGLVGKAELLAWAGDVTKIAPCDKYADLKDGLVFLALARELFPHDVDSAIVRLQRRGSRDASKNWSLLASCLRRHGIPTHLCSREAVERGHTRHCFNLLVLFYFVLRLARGEQFSVDFAQPVDPQLAAFLQSADGAAAVVREAAAVSRAASLPHEKAGLSLVQREGEEGVGEEEGPSAAAGQGSTGGRHPTVTRLSSPPSASSSLWADPTAALGGGVASRANGRHPGSPSAPVVWRGRAAHSPPQQRREDGEEENGGRGGGGGDGLLHSTVPSRLAAAQPWPFHATPTHTQSSGSALPRHPTSTHPRTLGGTEGGGDEAASSVTALQTENRLLRDELEYVKAVSQLLLTQERGAAAAAEMRAAATLRDELATARLTHLHELRQLEVALTAPATDAVAAAAAASPSSSYALTTRPHVALSQEALLHRLEVAERTAAQLYEELRDATAAHDADVQQLASVFRSIAALADAARPSASLPMPASTHAGSVVPSRATHLAGSRLSDSAAPSPSPATHSTSATAVASVYEAAVADAMMAQLSTIPAALQDAFRAQLGALLLSLNTVRAHNERLQAEAKAAASRRDAESSVSAAPLRLDVALLREETQRRCRHASPALQELCADLLDVVAQLQTQSDVARRENAEWQRRCRHAESAAASAEAALQKARAALEQQTGQREPSAAVPPPLPSSSSSSASALAEEAEEALRGCRVLHSRVAELLMATFSEADELVEDVAAVLAAFLERNRSLAACEGALAEQCETIARLRKQVREEQEARRATSAALRESEKRREEMAQRCTTLESQLSCVDRQGRRPPLLQRTWLPRANHGHPDERVGAATAAAVPPSPAAQGTSPCRAGALRSPSPSASDSDAKPSPSSTPSLRVSVDQAVRGVSVDRGTGARTSPSRLVAADAVSDRRPAVHEESRSPLLAQRPLQKAPVGQASSGAAAPSRLLSAAELERRKQEILRRYNVE